MRRDFVGLIAAVVIAVLVVGGVATAEKPVTTVKGNVHAEFNGGFWPKTLWKKKPTPFSVWISGRMRTLDGLHVPPLREFTVESDRDALIDFKGIPVCETGVRSQRTMPPSEIRRLCKEALVGSGRMEAEIAFYDQPPIPVKSELLAFNGGVEGGVTTLYLHAYITVPIPAAIVTPVKIKRIDKGRYGWQSTATIPKIAGGNGSVTFFKLTLRKGLFARCPDGRLDARAAATFASTPPVKVKAAAVRPCTGKVPPQGR